MVISPKPTSGPEQLSDCPSSDPTGADEASDRRNSQVGISGQAQVIFDFLTHPSAKRSLRRKTTAPCGCSGRIIERRKLLIRLRLVIPVPLMVVLYHSSDGRFGEKLAQLFRGAWLA